MTATESRGPIWYGVGVFLNAVIFAAIGPAIAALAIVLSVTGLVILGSPPSFGKLAGVPILIAGMSLLAIPIAYAWGWFAAATTGVIFAIVTTFISRAAWLYGTAVLVGAVCSYCLTDLRKPELVPDRMSIAAAGALAAFACARIARPFRLKSV